MQKTQKSEKAIMIYMKIKKEHFWWETCSENAFLTPRKPGQPFFEAADRNQLVEESKNP